MSASSARLCGMALLGSFTAAAGPVNQSWDVLIQKLKPREKVVVDRMNTGTVEGKLIEISAGAIAVNWHGQTERVAREDVFRVRIADVRKHRTLIGMAIGAVAGAVIFGASEPCSGCQGAGPSAAPWSALVSEHWVAP